MTCSFNLNMEKISIEIAEENILMMEDGLLYNNFSDDEFSGDEFLDDVKVINNIKYGFIIIVHIITFFESFLNTIINKCMIQSTDILLKMSIEEKIEVIYLYYNKDSKKVKSSHLWQNLKKVNKIRNELIHFKKGYIHEGVAIRDFSIADISVKDFFIKKNMEKSLIQILELTDYIAEELGLKIYKEVSVIATGDKDRIDSYVHNMLYYE